MTDAPSIPPSPKPAFADMPALDRLRKANSREWPSIAAARAESHARMQTLSRIVKGLTPGGEGALLVFGSLARGEYTAGSDLDWSILIDGRADSKHMEMVHAFRPLLKPNGFGEPGRTGVFGGLIFSHELIHSIGGEDDTNKNTTRRLLLILESAAVSVGQSDEVRQRVLRSVLCRYIEEDASFINPGEAGRKIPRFLLNDVVRFWRTMAVDYAAKYRDRGGEKWALKNIKLRMSRKLLMTSGLFMCLSWKLGEKGSLGATSTQDIVDHLSRWASVPPLESLARMIEAYGPKAALEVFDTYDEFLGKLNDPKWRAHFEGLGPEDAHKDPDFLDARKLCYRFDDELVELLYDGNKELAKLVRRYGVF